MDDRYEYLMRHGSGIWKSLRDGDFEEEEVWDVLRERKNSSNSKIEKSVQSSISGLRDVNLTPATARMIPSIASSGGSDGDDDSSNSNDSYQRTRLIKQGRQQQQSLPVSVPDWSKIRRKKPKESLKNSSSWYDDGGVDDDDGHCFHSDDDEDANEDEDNNYKVPPHELISRRLARSQISSFSVLEGVGRTLKGRDLSKVRNAVLTRTGFLESP